MVLYLGLFPRIEPCFFKAAAGVGFCGKQLGLLRRAACDSTAAACLVCVWWPALDWQLQKAVEPNFLPNVSQGFPSAVSAQQLPASCLPSTEEAKARTFEYKIRG